MGNDNLEVNMLIELAGGDMKEVKEIMNGCQSRKAEIERIPLVDRSRLMDDEWVNLADIVAGLDRYIRLSEGKRLGDIEEGSECDAYSHFIDLSVEPEVLNPVKNYPKFKRVEAGKVFNRRSVFLMIKWGNVNGKPVLRVAITRVGSRGEEDETLVKFDMPAQAVNGYMLKPKRYVFRALKEAKKQFSENVGCVVCGKPEIWFTKVKTPQYPLYRVMFKEMDFVASENRVCRECYKRVNPTVSDFDPHPEADLETSSEEIIAAYNLNRYIGKEWYLLDKGEGLVSSVNETVQIHGHSRLDSPDYMAALDREESIIQLGG